MITIICTVIICVTVLLCVKQICKTWKPAITTQQPMISQEDLDKAYKEAEKDKSADFQDVIEFINKEFMGIAEEDEDGR